MDMRRIVYPLNRVQVPVVGPIFMVVTYNLRARVYVIVGCLGATANFNGVVPEAGRWVVTPAQQFESALHPKPCARSRIGIGSGFRIRNL